MSTLYDRSKVSIWKASLSLQHVAGDDAFLESACFDTQQAIEFILKFILSEHGANYKKTHDIRYLAELLDTTTFKFDKSAELNNMADTITNWETGICCGSDIRTTVEAIHSAHDIYKSIDDAFMQMQESLNYDPKPLQFLVNLHQS